MCSLIMSERQGNVDGLPITGSCGDKQYVAAAPDDLARYVTEP